MAKMMLDNANISYEVVDAEDNKDLTVSLGVKSAPTLVVMNNGVVTKIENASNIKKFTEEYKA